MNCSSGDECRKTDTIDFASQTSNISDHHSLFQLDILFIRLPIECEKRKELAKRIFVRANKNCWASIVGFRMYENRVIEMNEKLHATLVMPVQFLCEIIVALGFGN